MKSILKAHALTILSIIAIIALAFPLYIMKAESSYDDISISVNGFEALQKSIFAVILILGPVIVIAMNYIKALASKKGMLAILVPVICIFALILVFIMVKSVTIRANGMMGDYGIDVSNKLGFGFILAILSYLGMIITGAVQYHGYTLDKAGIEKLKQEGSKAAEKAKAKAGEIQAKSGNSENDRK